MVSGEISVSKHNSIDALKREVDLELERNGQGSSVDLFGGEPTIQPHFFDIANYVKAKGIRCRLATNARTSYYKEFAKRIADLRFDLIRTSLYGHTAEVHEQTTQVPKSFEQTTQGIRNLTALGVPVLVNVVILKNNYQYLLETTKRIHDLGVRSIKFSSLIMTGNGYTNRASLAVKLSDIQPHLIDALKFADGHKMTIQIEKNPICIAPDFSEYFIKESDPKMSIEKTFSKSDECKGCIFDNDCQGVSVHYEELFGLSDLRPQTGQSRKLRRPEQATGDGGFRAAR